jgi:DNA repair protein RecO (recombination protein O)
MNKIVFEEVDNKELLMDYVKIELKILEVLGYGVDLSCCAVTNSQENLIFVSPKSARAVCGEAGMPYESKLLKLPRFLTGDLENVIIEEIGHGFKLSGYFLEKFVFSQNKLNLTARSSIESELFKLAQ